MELELSGKRVLITGGSRGIGYACAQTFAREGCEVHLVSSSEAALDAAVAKLRDATGVAAVPHRADLANPADVAALQPIVSTVDILVNNAGASPGGGLDAIDSDRWRAAWNLKVFGYIDLTRMALAPMMARGSGVIVNVIGIAGADPRHDYICGSTANAGLIAFTKGVGGHSTKRGVRVVGVNPGPTETDRLVRLYESRALASLGDATRWPELLADLPFGRPAHADEMADLVVFLASARASYLSGLVIDADGGAMYR